METGKQKVDRICSLLKEETLKPAQEEARRIIDEAKKRADEIEKATEQKRKEILSDADKELEKKKQIFESSLQLSCRNAFQKVRQSIETELFSDQLDQLLCEKLDDTDVIGEFIKSVAAAIEKEGLDTDIEVTISKNVSKEKLVKLLISKFKNKLDVEQVIDRDFAAGVKIKLVDQKITVDLSDQALKELLASFLHKEYREIVFNV